MRTILVLFDSLNRHALEAYGGKNVSTPNFSRFAEKAVTFDRHYVGSLPCIPARRDMQTGRLNFMHRSWGPLEPFDNSLPRLLSAHGVYAHIVTDHLHYFSDGGNGYTTAFDSWNYIRGQCYDPVQAMVRPPLSRMREMFNEHHYPIQGLPSDKPATRQTSDYIEWKRCYAMVNRLSIKSEEDYSLAKCFNSAFEFMEQNKESDGWFLQLECFDPHEPFFAPDRFKEAYKSGYDGKILDWPRYEKQGERVEYSPLEIDEIRANYAANVAMVDEYFGKLLTYMDDNGLWEGTCVMLTTDHGFLLSEHEWWGKNRTPFYEEISHIPLMIWHPDFASKKGERRRSLTQTIDLMPTCLEVSGAETPPESTGHSLLSTLESDEPVRDFALFGMFAGPFCVTDGRYTYFRYPTDIYGSGWNLYTLCPAHLAKMFEIEELRTATLVQPFDFTKDVPVLKVEMNPRNGQVGSENKIFGDAFNALYDLESDPGQSMPMDDVDIEQMLADAAVRILAEHDAPKEYYGKFELSEPAPEVRMPPLA